MTYRERREAKAAQRREWAEGREAKAATAYAVGNEHRDENGRLDWALVTQPGHIPERARINRAHDRGAAHAKMAAHHVGKAAGIEQQLDRSIYSDDPDAGEALEAKAAALEAQADRAKAINAAFRKAPGVDKAAKLASLLEAGTVTRPEALDAARLFGSCHWEKQPFPPYHLTNLRANARRCRERIKEVAVRAERQAAAEAAPGGVLITRHPEHNWASVTFDEKPERDILDALRTAGFGWGGGRWSGYLDKLPECVAQMGGATT